MESASFSSVPLPSHPPGRPMTPNTRRRHSENWTAHLESHHHSSSSLPKHYSCKNIKGELCSPDETPITIWRMAAIGAVGLAVEFCWAAGEALIVPYLMKLDLPVELAGLVWLSNPLVTVFIQPFMGHWSDVCTWRWGRRRPFIVGLSIFGSIGMVLLVFARQLFGSAFPGLVIGLGFVSYAMAHVAHNCLLGFGRALVGDSVPAAQVEVAHATFSMLQMIGRLLALLAGCLNLSIIFPFLTTDPHSQSLFLLSLMVLVLCTVVTCVAGKETPLEPSMVDEEEKPLLSDSPIPRRQTSTGETGSTGSGFLSNGKNTSSQSKWSLPPAMYTLLLMLLVGWVAIMTQAFYWTEWIGLDRILPGTNVHEAFLGLTAYAVASLLTVATLPALNQRVSAMSLLIFAELLLLSAMAVSGWVSTGSLAQTGLVSIFCGIGYAIHSNNPYVLVEGMAGDSDVNRRGLLGALVNATLTVGQIIVGAFAGLCIKLLDGSISAFFAAVGFGGFMALALIGTGSLLTTRCRRGSV